MPILRTISPIGYIIYTFGGLCQNRQTESLTDLKLVQNVYKIYHFVAQEEFYLKITQHFYIKYDLSKTNK